MVETEGKRGRELPLLLTTDIKEWRSYSRKERPTPIQTTGFSLPACLETQLITFATGTV